MDEDDFERMTSEQMDCKEAEEAEKDYSFNLCIAYIAYDSYMIYEFPMFAPSFRLQLIIGVEIIVCGENDDSNARCCIDIDQFILRVVEL